MSKKHVRKKLFVDREVQGGIIARAIRYWLLSVAVVGMITVIGWIFFAPGLATLAASPEQLAAMFTGLAVATIATTFLIPVVIYDQIKFTHRFAGPMVRLKDSMQRAAAGETVPAIRFRDEDYWKDFADAFNKMQARIPADDADDASVEAEELIGTPQS